MNESSGLASITVDDLLVLPAPAARRGLTRGMDAARDPAPGSCVGRLEPVSRALEPAGQANFGPGGQVEQRTQHRWAPAN
jgi:hypothetical protein